MHIALWIVQILLALMFIMEGSKKAFSAGKSNLPYSKGMITFIGAAELLGGIGLVLPQALNIATILTPLAAAGLGLIMIFAAIHHTKRKENTAIIMNIVFLALALFVMFGRM